MTRKAQFILAYGLIVTLGSLVAAIFTKNPNWPLNIPLGMAVGSMYGWIVWKLFIGR